MKNYVQRSYCLTTVLLLRKPHHFYWFAFDRYNIDFSGYITVQGQLQSHQGKNNNIYVHTKKYSCQNSAKLYIKFFGQQLALAGYRLTGVTKMDLHTIHWLIFCSSIDFVKNWVPKKPMFQKWNLPNEKLGIHFCSWRLTYFSPRLEV